MPIWLAGLLGGLAALACTVLSFIFVMPADKRPTLNKFFVFVHDLFNFKFLIIEKILKALYVFNTLFCIGFGFFGLFAGTRSYTFFGGESKFQSFALAALLIMIFGPIAVRLVYEAMMMFLLLVKNTTEINNKLSGNPAAAEKPAPAVAESKKPEAAPAAPAEPEYVYCSQCGARCTKDQLFCNQCGKKL